MKNVTLVSQPTDADASSVKAKPSFGERVKSHFTVQNMAVMAVLSAISFVLYMWVKFPLPFMFPSFLDMQISDLPALLGGFALGPFEGCFIIAVKCCVKMPFSSTACVGELGDLAIGIANVLPAALIYRFHKSKKGAIVGLAAGMVSAVVVSILMNWLVLIPFYANAYGMDAVVGMMKALYPDVTAANIYNYYLPAAVLPFNVLRCLVCALVTFFTYKPLSRILHWEVGKSKKDLPQENPANSNEQQQNTTPDAAEEPTEQPTGEAIANETDVKAE